MKKNHIAITFGILALVPFMALAQTDRGTTSKPTRPTGDRVAALCEGVTGRIEAHINRFENNHTLHEGRFSKLIARLSTLAAKLKAQGVTVTTLEAQIAELNTKFNKLKADKDAVIAKLRESKSYACGNSEGQFKTTLEAVRKLQQTVMADAKDIRDYFENTIKPTLESLKGSRPANATSTKNR